MVKLIMNWDIQSGKETEYFEFVMKEFAPGLMQLGLEPTDAWYTMYGNRPQVLTGSVAGDLDTMRQILSSEEWHKLHERLMDFVNGYHQKVVRATGGFQF
jgi:hypothetical protein